MDGEYIWKYTQQGLRLQHPGRHADHLSHRVGPTRRFPGYAVRASVPNYPRLDGLCGLVQRGGAFLRDRRSAELAPRRWAGRKRSVPHRPRRAFQPDDSPAIPAVEARPLGRASTGATIAAWWRAPCRARAAIAPMDRAGYRLRRGCVDYHAGSTVPGRTLLQRRVCDPDHSDQSRLACARRPSTLPNM